MKSKLGILFLLLSPLLMQAQLIRVQASDVLISQPDFNPAFVKANHIKSITAHIENKPDDHPINNDSIVRYYEFDQQGYLSKMYFTMRKGVGLYDTIATNYFYNNQHRLIIKRTNEGDFYNSWYYEYDVKGNLSKQTNFRETNSALSTGEFKLGTQTVISMETFTYDQLTPTQVKKKCLNDEGKPYKKAIINYDKRGRMLSENYQFIYSWIRNGYQYKYAGGHMTDKTYTSNASGNLVEHATYLYDSKGNLATEKKYKNKTETDEIDYLYDDSRTLIKSSLDRDYIGLSIAIIHYNYTFY